MSDFNENSDLLTIFSKKFQVSNFMKTRSVGAELFHVDGMRDIMKLKIAFQSL